MKDTVFAPSFGNRPSSLVGRDQTVQSIMDGLQSAPGTKERAVVMLGQRGSGKTVLLWEIADRAKRQGYVVATPTVATENMLGRIVEKIQDAGEPYVEERGTHATGGSVGILGFSFGLQFTREVEETKSFQYKLTRLARKLTEEGHGIVILIDELQASSPEIRQLVTSYQELVGEGLDVSLVMAGLPGAVSATLNDHVLTFLNRAKKMQLEPLTTTDVDAYFAKAFAKLGIDIEDELRRKAAHCVQGSPYMLQLIGHSVVMYSDDGSIDSGMLNEALASAQEDFKNDICGTSLAAVSEVDEFFLQAMSMDDGPSKMSEIAKRLDVSSDYAQKYRKRLIAAGLIRASGWGEVSFAVPYLADYLRQTGGQK